MLVNHLTRMRDSHICVAGLTPEGEHLRPQRKTGRWTRDHLYPHGPFEIGAVVRLGPLRHGGAPPEVEDAVVAFEDRLERRRRLGAAGFWEQLTLHCADSVRHAFGDELVRHSTGSASVPEGAGQRSLGCVRGTDVALVLVDRKPRITFVDSELGPLQLSLTDVRVCDAQHRPVPELLEIVARRLGRGEDVILSLGLSRAMSFGDRPPAHWLQVNNIHFVDYLDDHQTFQAYRPS